MATKMFATDEEVEREIERLTDSEYVKLARRVRQLKNKRRQRMYMLRSLEAKGKALASKGYTLETVEKMLADLDDQEIEQ